MFLFVLNKARTFLNHLLMTMISALQGKKKVILRLRHDFGGRVWAQHAGDPGFTPQYPIKINKQINLTPLPINK